MDYAGLAAMKHWFQRRWPGFSVLLRGVYEVSAGCL
jgi:hypothetical protein